MSRDSDLSKIIKNAQVQGFRYTKTSTGHHQLYAPNRKDIITTSGTPGDSRGWNNFLADLKRAGYMELQTLGDAMPKKADSEEELPKPKPTVNQYIVDLLKRHPEGMSSSDIGAYIHSVRPDVGKTAYSGALTVLHQSGVINKSGQGFYKTGSIQLKAQRTAPTKAKTPVESKPEVFRNNATENTSIDKDMKAMDIALNDALVALTKVDTIAQRMKSKLAKFAQLRELLK